MKKMLLGILLLLLIIAAVSINSYVLNSRLNDIKNVVIETRSLSPDLAEDVLKSCFEKWKDYHGYFKVILSDGRLEKVSDAFFDCIEYPEGIIRRNKLIYEIEQLIESERLSFPSIF